MSRLGLPAILIGFIAVGGCSRPAVKTSGPPNAVLWREPSVGRSAAPRPPVAPFQFVEEDSAGDSPKFLVTDAAGTRWQVKLGPEAQAETVAVRIVTAAGFFAEETYFVPQAEVDGIQRLARGREFITREGTVRHARFEARRESVRRGEPWDWARNPFVGTIELDALRTMMVLFANYDARTDNNRILAVRQDDRSENRYVVADLGASFGEVGGMGGRRTKNDLAGYRHSAFIERVDHDHVRFAYTTTPRGWARTMFVLNPWYVAGERKKTRDLRSVPLPAARWLAGRLRPLAPQIRAAFDEAGYSAADAAGFMAVITARIAQLSQL